MSEDTDSALLTGDQPLELGVHAVRLLSEGEPVPLARLAAASGRSAEAVEQELRAFPGTDWDDQGRLCGLGLTLRPTRHRFTVDGRQMYTWCAMDTLLFPVLLGRTARVASTCPVTGRPVSLIVSPAGVRDLAPPEAVVSEACPSGPVTDMRAGICDHGFFFVSAEAAAEWRAEHPDGRIRTVARAFEAARTLLTNAGLAASGEGR